MSSIKPFSYETERISKPKYFLIKQKIHKLLLESSAHGLPRLARTNRLIFQLIWVIVLINSLVWGSYFSINTVLHFLKYDATTTISMINENLAEFPAITFCAIPSFDKPLNQTITRVTFGSWTRALTEENFEEFNDTLYGRCFRFNSGKNGLIAQSTMSGLEKGLWIDFNLIPSIGYDFSEILINFHNKSNWPFDISDGCYYVTTGNWYTFKLDRVYNQLLDEPYNDCIKDVESFKLNKSLINLILSLNMSYTQKNCYRFCSFMFALEKSNCDCNSNVSNFQRDCIKNSSEWFKLSPIKKCIKNYLDDFETTKAQILCSEYCPLECDSINLVVSSFVEMFPSQGIISNISKKMSYLSNFRTYDEVKKSFVRIQVYYDSMKYTLISQNPKTALFNCISSIGGIFSLFFGISFISLIELFEIIYEVFIILV